MSQPESPHLTVAELARRLKTTPRGIYNRRHRGTAPPGFTSTDSGGEVLFPLAGVEAWEAARLDADRSNPANDPTQAEPEAAKPRRKPANAA